MDIPWNPNLSSNRLNARDFSTTAYREYRDGIATRFGQITVSAVDKLTVL